MKTQISKVGLIGFGKAGKAVASVILRSAAFSLEWIFRNKSNANVSSAKEILDIESDDKASIFSRNDRSMEELLDGNPVDFIIDFSSAQGIYEYGRQAGERNVTIISAISHYGDKEKNFLKELSEKTAVFWAPNITLGINFLLMASKLLRVIAPDADVEIVEEHFKQKSGVSGSAVKIARELDVDPGNINSIRAGGIVGKHQLIFGFPYQTVRLIHESISREAFGTGALFAAANMVGKPKGLYSFEDLLAPYFKMG